MIYCANNNKLYESGADASRDLGIDQAVISKHLSGQRKTAGPYVLAKVTDISPAAIQAARAWMLFNAYHIIMDAGIIPILYVGGENE